MVSYKHKYERAMHQMHAIRKLHEEADAVNKPEELVDILERMRVVLSEPIEDD
jgi:hypothetical protein